MKLLQVMNAYEVIFYHDRSKENRRDLIKVYNQVMDNKYLRENTDRLIKKSRL